MTAMKDLGLYFHVPFCRGKCGYCAFNSRPLRDEAELARYADALVRELAAHRERLAGAWITTVYFGGGTPALLPPDRVAALLAQARAMAGGVANDVEVTLEANPDTLDDRALAGFRAAGVNRISLGVQSFDAAALAFLERRHRPDQAAQAVGAARRAGFDNLSLDLIAGLPAPHAETYRADLAAALALAPEHLSVYLLAAEKPSRLHDAVQAGRITLPDADRQADVYLDIDRALTAAGYAHYEVSNYARPGREARHNAAYWAGVPYLGLGAGAHSYGLRDGRPARWANAGDPDDYVRRMEAGTSPVDFAEEVTPAMARRERLMLALRTAAGIDVSQFGAAAPALADALSRHAAEGRFTRDGSRFRPTPAGLLVADGIAAELWDAL